MTSRRCFVANCSDEPPEGYSACVAHMAKNTMLNYMETLQQQLAQAREERDEVLEALATHLTGQRQREETWPAVLKLKVEIATGGGFEFEAPAATFSYERGEEVWCSTEGCQEPPTVNLNGTWYCAGHDPNGPVYR